MADPKQQADSSDAAARRSEANPVSTNGGGLQKVLFEAFLNTQEQVRRNVDHAGRLAAVLAVQQEISSGDQDLGEVLRLVSSRAVSILGATGSAIALERDGAMVCRATAGATGPGLGAYLAGDSGVTAACLRTGQIMRCGDSESDPRVDAQAARTLGIRSMVVAPLFHNGVTVGVFEVFSAKPHFFEDEDSHVIELLSGLVTSAISYASEFEVKQTLDSKRTAMLQVLEEIKPAIEKILRQPPDAAEPKESFSTEPLPAQPNEWLDGKPVAEPVAEMQTGNGWEEPPEPPPPAHSTASDWVPFMLAPHRRAKSTEPADVHATPEPPPPMLPPVNAIPPAFSSPARAAADDEFEMQEPEPPPPGFAAAQHPSMPPVVAAEPPEPPALSKPVVSNQPETKFERLPHAAPSVPPDMVATLPTSSKASRLKSPFLSWAASWRGKLRGRGGAHVPAPQTAGAATQAENEFHLSLRWRNLMEYAVPAILTGLLIVIGLQWMTDRRLPAPDFGWGALRTPAPSLGGAPMPAANPVEISPYVSSAATGLGRTGKSISSGVKSMVGGRGPVGAKDWSPSMPKLGGKIADSGITAPVTGKDAPAISALESVSPSTRPSGNAVTLPSAGAAPPPSNEQVIMVRMPEKVLDEFLLVRVQPIYPPVAQEKGLTGTVVLNAVIARDGSVKGVRSLSGNKFLAESAVTAVSQWRYKPFVLNGKPVEVATELRISFKKQPWAR